MGAKLYSSKTQLFLRLTRGFIEDRYRIVTHPIKVKCVGPDHPQPVEGVQPEHHHQAAHDDAPCVSGVRA